LSLPSPFYSAAMAAVEMSRLLVSEDPATKVRALESFVGAYDASCGDSICQCLADGDMLVREAAARALASAGDLVLPMAEQIAKLLVSGDMGARCAAVEVLGALASGAAPYATSIAALLQEDVQDASAAALAAPCVAKKQKDALRIPKCAAAEALPKLGPSGRSFAAAVAKLLVDKLPEVRCAAAASLGAMGAEGAAHEDAVMKALASERDPRAAAAAVHALAEMGRARGVPSFEAVAAVVKLISSQHPGVRSAAVRALGAAGEQAAPHMAKLFKCLSDRSPQVKIAAVGALAELGPAGQVYAADVARLAHDEWQLPSARAAAIDALALMGDRGAAFEDEVAELLADPSEEVQEAASRFLQSIGGGYYT